MCELEQRPADHSTMTTERLAEEIVDALKAQGYRVTKKPWYW